MSESIESIGSIDSSGLRAFSVEAEDSSFNLDLSAVIVARVLSGLWALITLELGFLWRPFDGAAGWADDGVADARPGVEATIEGLPCSGS